MPTGAPYNPNTPDANDGTAGHKAFASVPLSQEPDLDAIAGEFGVDADDLGFLVGRAKQAWGSVGHWFRGDMFPEHTLEAMLSETVLLRGTTDLLAVASDGDHLTGLAVLDWKAGHAPGEHPTQVRSYAYLAHAQYGMPTSGYVLGAEVWLRVGEIRIHKFTAADLDRLREELLAQVKQAGKQYGPSEHACRYCPRRLECPARHEYARSGALALAPIAEDKPITRELIGELYDQYKVAKAAMGQYERVLREMASDGGVPLPDGRMVSIEETQQDKILPSAAMQWVTEELRATPADLDELLTLTKSGLQRVMKGRAPARKGAAYTREAMKQLRDRGAVEKVTKKALKVTKGIES